MFNVDYVFYVRQCNPICSWSQEFKQVIEYCLERKGTPLPALRRAVVNPWHTLSTPRGVAPVPEAPGSHLQINGRQKACVSSLSSPPIATQTIRLSTTPKLLFLNRSFTQEVKMGSQVSASESHAFIFFGSPLSSNPPIQTSLQLNISLAIPAMALPASVPSMTEAAASKPKVRLVSPPLSPFGLRICSNAPPSTCSRTLWKGRRRKHKKLTCVKRVAVLCLQGREGQAGRVHAVLQRRRSGQGLQLDHRPIPQLHEGLRLRGMIAPTDLLVTILGNTRLRRMYDIQEQWKQKMLVQSHEKKNIFVWAWITGAHLQ